MKCSLSTDLSQKIKLLVIQQHLSCSEMNWAVLSLPSITRTLFCLSEKFSVSARNENFKLFFETRRVHFIESAEYTFQTKPKNKVSKEMKATAFPASTTARYLQERHHHCETKKRAKQKQKRLSGTYYILNFDRKWIVNGQFCFIQRPGKGTCICFALVCQKLLTKSYKPKAISQKL